MENMNELYAAYAEKRGELKKITTKIEKHTAAIARLEKKRDKLWDTCGWVKMLVYPLADALKDFTGAEKYKVYGPFGLRADCSIYVKKGNMLGEITLTFDSNWRLHYDTGEKDGSYERGSIGDLNGFDNVTAPLPDSVSEIAALLRWFEKEE